MESLHNLQDKIDYIFENNDAIYALAGILANETNEFETKSDIAQILAALSAYPGGLTLVLRCFEIWKERQNERYRFGPLIDELFQCKNFSYVTTLTVLVNCMLAGCDSVEERVRLRNELLGLRLQETFDKLRMVPALCDHSTELQKQLDSFDERKMADDMQVNGPEGVDLNSHADIFDAIMKQVSQKPHEMLFLNILQHLLQIDARDSLSDSAWEAAEKLVYRAKLISSKEEADKLLRIHTLSVDNRSQCHCGANNNNNLFRSSSNSSGSSSSNATIIKVGSDNDSATQLLSSPERSSKVPQPPMLNGNGPPPLPPPLPPTLFPLRKSASASNNNVLHNNSNNNSSSRPLFQLDSDVPDGQTAVNTKFELPAPKQKLKTFAWNKLPLGKITNNSDNIWSKAAVNCNSYSLDFDSLESLFCQVPSQNSLERKSSSVALTLDQKKSEINLLDSKRSLNVNIFLRQFKGDMQDLVELITSGYGSKIGLEKLRSLIKLMPELDEIDTLTNFTDDKNKLGSAEKFFLALIGVNNYQLRIECMLLKEEFTTVIDYVKPSVQVIICAASDLKNNKLLQELLYLVLMVGNYLNSGSYGGNAAGFKVTSLWKLMEIRANKPNMTLLHYVVMEADKNKPALLDFANQMKHLEDASKVSIDTIVSDFRSLKEKTDRISRQLSPELCLDVWKQMSDFLESAKRELTNMQRKIDDMERLRLDLASFFCEDPHSFKLEDCLKIFQHFCTRFNKAIDENNERKIQEEKVEMRKKLKQQQQLKRDSSSYDTGSFIRGAYERRSLNTSRSHELLDVLNRSQESLDVDENVITNSKVRRSLRRRVTAMNDMMGNNERERPLRPWRQRLEQLMNEEECCVVTSNRDKAKLRYSLDLSPETVTVSEPSTSASTECSPIFARTFGRMESARISSVSDIRRPALVTPSGSYRDSLETIKNEPSKSTWRLDRDKRSQSLYMGPNGNCAEDLNELLQTLEDEKKEHANMIIGRRYSRNAAGGSDVNSNEPQLRSYRSFANNIAEESSNIILTDNNNAPTNRQYSSPSSTPTTRSRSGTNEVFQTNGFKSWRDRIKEEIPDYTYSVDVPATEDNKTNIDEVVRHVEKTRNEIEQYALTLETDNVTRVHADHLDSGIDLHTSDPRMDAQMKSPLPLKEVDTENEPLNTECLVDFSLPSNFGENVARLENNDDLSALNTKPATETLNLVKPVIAREWRSPRSPEDQSDARSTESPTESVGDRDEGFETESHSTIALNDHTAPINSASMSADTKAIVNKQRPRPNFMYPTNSSAVRGTINSIDKPRSSPNLAKPRSTGTSGSSLMKRMMDTISNKKTQTKITSSGSKVASPVAKSTSVLTKLPTAVVKPNVATQQKRTNLSRSNTNVSSNSSSSHEGSPIRKPKTPSTTVSSRSNETSTKSTTSSRSTSSSIKTPRTVNSKQKQIQMRSRVEALKENASSSDSEKLSPIPQQKRIPPKVASKSPKSTEVQMKKMSPIANEKVYQRLLSPPKVKRPASLISNLNEISNTQITSPNSGNGPLLRQGSVRPIGHNGLMSQNLHDVLSPENGPQGRRAPSLEPVGNKQKKVWR